MNVLRNLANTNDEIGTAITRLSTGLRINSGADDPAGLIISEGMRSQIKGTEQAIRNSQDAINMTRTAEGALDEVQRLLRNIRGLAVQSANQAVVDKSQLEANQNQIRSTLQSIDRIATHTQWGNKRLLDGAAGVTTAITEPDRVAGIYIGGTINGSSVAAGPITLTPVTQATRAIVTLDVATFTNGSIPNAGTFVINGYTFSANGSTDTIQDVIAKINAQSSNTGVIATTTTGSPFAVVLRAVEFGADFSISLTDPSGVLDNPPSPPVATGNDGVVTLEIPIAESPGTATVTFTGGRGARESGLRLSDNNGNTIVLTPNGNSQTTTEVVGTVFVGNVRFQIGPNANQNVSFSLPSVRSEDLGGDAIPGQNLATLDVTTTQGAEDAIRIIDSAITQLAGLRGEIGSFQANFLESTVRSLSVAQENLTASESQIRDADMASSITEFTRLQILQQTATSVLAQANQTPQSVLQLLRGG